MARSVRGRFLRVLVGVLANKNPRTRVWGEQFSLTCVVHGRFQGNGEGRARGRRREDEELSWPLATNADARAAKTGLSQNRSARQTQASARIDGEGGRRLG